MVKGVGAASRRAKTRAGWLARVVAGAWLIAAGAAGCGESAPGPASVELVWGRRGLSEGRLQKPRAVAIDSRDQLYIVDMTARVQVFSADGEYLRGWRTPACEAGKPCGLSFDRAGRLLVADTHYFRMLVYTPEGALLESRTIGGVNGPGPGQFGFVTDCAQDSRGEYYIAEYGEHDRVQKFSARGEFLTQWGRHGSAPGEFLRPQSLAVDEHDHLWIADACNHRVQVFDATGPQVKLLRVWGREGSAPGELRYPYGLALDGAGHVYVCEYGNHRVQKFTRDGRFVAAWGEGGRRPGELNQPWSLARDSQGRLHVLDSHNHRVQRIRF